MKIGFIGLGRMGSNMVLNLLGKKYKVVVYNRSPEPTRILARRKAIPSYSLVEFLGKLPKRKIIWLMVTSKAVDEIINSLSPLLKKGDIIIDGGNSYYKDSIRRHNMLKDKGIYFLDCGTSGGTEGARHGACMMIGGDKNIFKRVESLFRDMSVKDGYGYMGKPGAGHYVKMVHNGIEYGMMASIAEGLQVIENNKDKLNLDLTEAIKVYSHGSIVESRLMSWTEKAWRGDKNLTKIRGNVPKGETEDEMVKLKSRERTKMAILNQAIKMRRKTRRRENFAGKIISAMRNQFGGHSVNKAK